MSYWVKNYFEREARPLLLPVGLDPAHPFPQIANKSLNFIVRLSGKDAFGRDNEIAIVKVPRSLPRVIQLPEKISGRRLLFVSISSVIRAHLEELFPGRVVGEFSQFRVTRHSDLAVDEEDVKNLRTALRHGLVHRNFGQAIRLEVSEGCSQYLADFLLHQFELPLTALYRVHGPVNLVRLNQLIDLIDRPKWLFPPFHPSFPKQFKVNTSIFEQLQTGDVLIHQPYESFDGVLAFLREAVRDKHVLAIKQTIYRTGADSELMELLREAVQRGKEVTVVVELKARFDEEANLHWKAVLEEEGVKVLIGMPNMKVHAKLCVIKKKQFNRIKYYGFIATGNFNESTSKVYGDHLLFTSHTQILRDVNAVFMYIEKPLLKKNPLDNLKLLVATPKHMRPYFLNLIQQEIKKHKSSKQGELIIKLNRL